MKSLPLPLPLTLALALSLSGCAGLLPAVEHGAPAELPVPATLAASAVKGSVAASPDLAWRQLVNDKRLAQLIELALANNRDLRLATLNIDAARAQYRISDAQRLPTLKASAGSVSSQASNSAQLSVSLGLASWELDLWGRLGQLKDAALSSYLASEQTQRSVQATLIAELSQAWLTLGANEQLLQLATQTLESRQQSLSLTQTRKTLGALSGLDLASAQAATETARGDLASACTSRQQALNALRLLVGAEPPAALLPGSTAAEATALLSVPGELSSQVLLQRPDVRAAELSLQAARANVAAARAALFPTISLTASAGTASGDLSGLFGAGSGVWSFAPSNSLPIFDGGTSRANLDSAQVSQQIQLTTYEQVIQTAFKEVADALAERADLSERLDAQQKLVTAYQDSLRLSSLRYRSGAETGLAMLDAQRSLYSAQQALIRLNLTEQTNRLTLFKVLGGA